VESYRLWYVTAFDLKTSRKKIGGSPGPRWAVASEKNKAIQIYYFLSEYDFVSIFCFKSFFNVQVNGRNETSNMS
jgi:hypothetical protein